jgi:hypothetical protein
MMVFNTLTRGEPKGVHNNKRKRARKWGWKDGMNEEVQSSAPKQPAYFCAWLISGHQSGDGLLDYENEMNESPNKAI